MIRSRRSYTFLRFSALTAAAVNCDLQLHTDWTDGQADIASILRRAAERGLQRIAFTEHVRRTTDWFPAFVAAVRQASTAYPDLAVLVGCETKALDTRGTLDASDEILAACDIVLGSVHSLFDVQGKRLEAATLSAEEFAQVEFEMACGLLRHAPIDVLAHPGGMYFRRQGDFPAEQMRALLRTGHEYGVAVEINSAYVSDFAALLRLFAEVDPPVSIGSDAHHLHELGVCRDRLRAHGVGV